MLHPLLLSPRVDDEYVILRRSRRGRVPASTNPAKAGSRWGLNRCLKTAAYDSSLLRSRTSGSKLTVQYHLKTAFWTLIFTATVARRCQKSKFTILTSTTTRSSSTGNVGLTLLTFDNVNVFRGPLFMLRGSLALSDYSKICSDTLLNVALTCMTAGNVLYII